MSNYNSLKATINANIKTNGNQEITGSVLNSVLNAMVTTMGAGYQFAGIATPSTNPGSPDNRVFYLAERAGTYTHMGGVVLSDGEIAIIKWDTSWSKDVTGAATQEQILHLSQSILPIEVVGNELLSVPRYLENNKYVEVANGQIRTYSGWNCYVIPVTPGKTYSYKPVNTSSTYNYALFCLDASRNPVKAYGANTSLPAIQALSGEPFPADNQYGFKEITIPNGVTYVVFNKDLNISGSPVFFEGVADSYSDAFVRAINYKRLLADNGVTENERLIIDFLGGLIVDKPENALKFPAGAATPTSAYSGYNSRYAVVIAPDFEHTGILGKVLFSTAATADYTFHYAIFKKVYTNGEVSSLTEIRTGAISVPSGATEIDFSPLNIEMQSDYLLGFYSGSDALKNPIRYAVDNTNGFPLWTIYSGGTSVFPNKITVDFDYTILYKDLDIGGEEKFGDINIVVLGDSITWLGGDDCRGRQNPSRGWTTYFMNKIMPKSIASYARSGATWSHTANTQYDITENTGSLSDDNVIYNQINRLIAAVNGGTQAIPDLIIIAAGTNDAWYPSARPDALSVDADTEFANTDGYITSQAVNTLTSIAAAMRYDIELLKTNFPNCQIMVTTPLQATAFTLTRCFDVGKIIKDCAKYLSVECVDQGADAGIYRAQEKTAFLFTYDGTHTSAIGAKMVGQFIAQRVFCSYRDKIE